MFMSVLNAKTFNIVLQSMVKSQLRSTIIAVMYAHRSWGWQNDSDDD